MKTLILALLIAATVQAMTFEEARTQIYNSMGQEKPPLGMDNHTRGGYLYKKTKAKIDFGSARAHREAREHAAAVNKEYMNSPKVKAEAKRLELVEALNNMHISVGALYHMEHGE